MKQIMKIEDSFSTKEAGVIVSGINSEFDSFDFVTIKQLIGEKVRIIEQNGQELEVDVRDVAINESLVGKKSISIAFGEIKGVEQFDRGGSVYTVD
jgi:hypothetical protein